MQGNRFILLRSCTRLIWGVVLGIGMTHLEAQLPYSANPDWRSSDRHYATGGLFADINRDGLPDFVVSNGNDMRRERVAVYYKSNECCAWSWMGRSCHPQITATT